MISNNDHSLLCMSKYNKTKTETLVVPIVKPLSKHLKTFTGNVFEDYTGKMYYF